MRLWRRMRSELESGAWVEVISLSLRASVGQRGPPTLGAKNAPKMGHPEFVRTRRWVTRYCAAPPLGSDRLALHFFSGVEGDQSVDCGLQQALHHHREIVVGEADAMVGEAVLGEVVGADFFAAIAGADLLFALLRLDLVDALGFDFV